MQIQPIVIGTAGHSSCTNLAEFCDVIRRLKPSCAEASASPRWYRGHSDRSWRLVPSMERPRIRGLLEAQARSARCSPSLADAMKLESDLFDAFRTRGAHLLPDHDDIVTSYFLARHHRLPTRLLDWTVHSLVALFFATEPGAEPSADGEIIVMELSGLWTDPGALGMKCQIGAFLWDHSTVKAAVIHVVRMYGKPYFDSAHSIPDYAHKAFREDVRNHLVLPIVPPALAGRMLSQASRFTLHVPREDLLSDDLEWKGMGGFEAHLERDEIRSSLHRIVIPAANKRAIQLELADAGISGHVLYPDLDHLVRSICQEHCVD